MSNFIRGEDPDVIVGYGVEWFQDGMRCRGLDSHIVHIIHPGQTGGFFELKNKVSNGSRGSGLWTMRPTKSNET